VPLLVALWAIPAGAASEEWSENALTAAYLYNFARFVEWPADRWITPDAPLVIGIIGNARAAGEVSAALSGRTIQGRPVGVWHLVDPASAGECHLVWVDSLAAGGWPDLRKRLDRRAVLTVGREEAFARQGGIIGLYMEEARLRFVINQEAAARARLRISSKLLALAAQIQPEATP
jgi:hypothetical protein